MSLSLPRHKDRYIGDPVIAVFDNLLPDSDDIRCRVAARMEAVVAVVIKLPSIS